MGKDLVSVDNESLEKLDSKSILSTFNESSKHKRSDSEHIANLVDEIVMLGVDDELPQTPTKETKRQTCQKYNTPPRNRFNDKLSTLKIMEARSIAKAELGIAFEMLKMMKERGLRADPETYECLIGEYTFISIVMLDADLMLTCNHIQCSLLRCMRSLWRHRESDSTSG